MKYLNNTGICQLTAQPPKACVFHLKVKMLQYFAENWCCFPFSIRNSHVSHNEKVTDTFPFIHSKCILCHVSTMFSLISPKCRYSLVGETHKLCKYAQLQALNMEIEGTNERTLETQYHFTIIFGWMANVCVCVLFEIFSFVTVKNVVIKCKVFEILSGPIKRERERKKNYLTWKNEAFQQTKDFFFQLHWDIYINSIRFRCAIFFAFNFFADVFR